MSLIPLDALGANGSYHSRNVQTIADLAGTPIAELSLVPTLFVNRTMSALRKATSMPAAERNAALKRAGRIFATETINGQSTEEYILAVSRVSGMPISIVAAVTERTSGAIAGSYAHVQAARPQNAVNDWRDPLVQQGKALWTRRGDVFAVHAAGNHPGVHSLWAEAIALGYRVAVRPSRREPFTPHRIISAMRLAGFGDDQVALLPTDYVAADAIIAGADLAMAYGGDDVMAKYASNPKVLPQGPGRSKILVTGENWREHLDLLVDSISNQGGTACVNTTSVFVEGDPTPVAQALAQRLGSIPSLPPEDPAAILPSQPLAVAEGFRDYLAKKAVGATPLLGADQVVDPQADGSAILRPAVHQVDDAYAEQTGIELSFPCVWVAPWSKTDGISPLRNSLVLTLITDDDDLIEAAMQDPSIVNVYLGDVPTYWIEPGLPHDGYLAEFLMRTKTVIRN
jgi:acyl-CoA reductase-like NAD-dependent aldehyde dehydrogenase